MFILIMFIFALFKILVIGLLVAALVLPWISRLRIQSLQKEVNRLTNQVAWLISYTREKGADVPEQWEILSETSSHEEYDEFVFQEEMTEKSEEEPSISTGAIAKTETSLRKLKEPSLKKKFHFKNFRERFEKKFTQSLPVWIGGVALALAGAFLVKYSIEMGFLSPSVRIAIGTLFGVGLLLFGNWIHDKNHIANGKRISQALSGAGIADLYVCLFAATSFYNLISPLFGFIGMGSITAIAVVLSLKQGPPIAMLGMVGGFLTPALIESKEPNAQFLFLYLYFVLAGIFTIIRRKNWWFIAIPVVIAAFLWVIFWMATSYSPDDSLWLGIFLIAVCSTVAFQSRQVMAADTEVFRLFPILNYLTMGGAVLLMSIVAAESNFGQMEWGLFGFIAAGGIVLSYYNQNVYGFIPWISGIMNVILLLAWQEPDPTILASTLLGFSLLYTISSYWLMWKADNPLSWSLLAAASSLIYYVLAYSKFHNWTGEVFFTSTDWYTDANLWGVLALGLFFLSCLAVVQVLNRFQGEEGIKEHLLTIFTLTATTFLSIGLTLELNHEFLTVALATETLAVSWINRHVQIKVLRPLAGALAIIFGVLIIPQILFQILLISNHLTNLTLLLSFIFGSPMQPISSYLQNNIPSIKWSLFHLGLPALMFMGSSVLLRQQKDDRLIQAFEMAAIALLTVLSYYLVRHAFHPNDNLFFASSTFIERGVLTNIYFLYGLICLWLGRKFNRNGVLLSGGILVVLSLLRIVFFDLLSYNPLWTHQQIEGVFLFNTLILPYGLPILWLTLLNKEIIKIKKQNYLPYTNVCLFALLFLFVSFNVRQMYHGQYLDTGMMSSAEVYTYSAAWLLMGIGLLFFGTLRQDKTLRLASLAFLILTVGKVFLFDASELTDLYRVFSFLGLGVSLLGLSWFYSRFVFKRSNNKPIDVS
ncbi:MAG: DUF2339 domain-containing protein [Proteobacteria bacterium]|nr:DUF2339 domain-containing protein [Pseudomonadota bacterium]